MHGIESGCGEGLWRNCSRPKPLASHLGTQQLWLQSFLWMVVAVDAGPPQALSEDAGPALRRPRPEGLPVAEAEDAEVPVLLQPTLASPVVAQAEDAVPPALRRLLLVGLSLEADEDVARSLRQREVWAERPSSLGAVGGAVGQGDECGLGTRDPRCRGDVVWGRGRFGWGSGTA